MRQQLSWFLTCVGILALSAGCGGKSSGDGKEGGAKGAAGKLSVAVIDLDEIAKQTKQTDIIEKLVKAANQNLENQLKEIQAKSRKEYDDLKALIGDKPDEKQSEKLNNLEAELNRQLTEKLRQAQQLSGNLNQQVVAEYRTKIKPIALKAAQERGCEVVLLKNDLMLLAYGESVDITSDVIKVLETMEPLIKDPSASANGATDTKAADSEK